MKKQHVAMILALAALLVPAAATPVMAGKGQGGKQAQSQQKSEKGVKAKKGGAESTQAKSQTKSKTRVTATVQQRNEVHACTEAAQRVRTAVRTMTRTTKSSGFQPNAARQQHERIQQQVRSMNELHQTMMQSLGADQKRQLQARIKNAESLQTQIQERLRAMNGALGSDSPDRGQLRKQSREMEKLTKRWQKEYRRIESSMNVS